MADVQRDQPDTAASRSKIYGVPTSPNRHSHKLTSDSHTVGKKRHESHNTSFLPQVGPTEAHIHRGKSHQHHEKNGQLHEHDASHGYSSHDDDSGEGHRYPTDASALAAESGDGGQPGGQEVCTQLAKPKRSLSAHSITIGHHTGGANENITFANISKALATSQQQAAAANGQSERLRILLREKDVETMRLKHENIFLKQMERRHQKDIEQFEAQSQDAPRLIRGMREEIANLKHKLKVYFLQIGEDSRQLRQIDEERRRLREQNQRLEKLVAAKNLADCDSLNSQLEEANKKIADLDRANSDLLKKVEITEKNLINDNRQLRGKVHSLERENQLINDRTKKLDSIIHEKDKKIASLSIYRYNIVHHKNDAVCKVCLKREKEETEFKRKQQIREGLPSPISPIVVVTSATSVQITLSAPSPKNDIPVLSWLMLYYSNDPAMSERAKSRRVSVDSSGKIQEKDRVFVLNELEPGSHYYFHVTTGHDDVESDPSRPEIVLVDAIPSAPTAITTTIILSPPSIRIAFKPPMDTTGTAVTKYRVYSSSSSAFHDRFLVLETDAADAVEEHDGTKAVTYYDPQVSVPLYFKIAAVNTMGEGPLSDTSSETILDFPPNQPSKPTVKKISLSSVQISANVKPNKGTPVQSFVVVISKVQSQISGQATGNSTEQIQNINKEIVVPTTHGHPNDLLYIIDNLERGTIYRFSVQASSFGGDSPMSELSDNVDIDALIPTSGDPTITVLSPSSIQVEFPSVVHIEQPKLEGFKIVWSIDPDLHTLSGFTQTISLEQLSYTVHNLPEGECLYVSICLIGMHEEGMYSNPIFVPLAAGISLPRSPTPTPEYEDILNKSQYSSINALYKTASKGSILSISQRVVNMHHGMPAYHDPPIDETGISPRGSMDLSHRGQDDHGRDSNGKRVGLVNRSQRMVPALTGSKSRLGKSTGNLLVANSHEKGFKSLSRSVHNLSSNAQLLHPKLSEHETNHSQQLNSLEGIPKNKTKV
ncbi:hypothetical protein BDV3_006364 [Batrachochytrium dendrobatidis]